MWKFIRPAFTRAKPALSRKAFIATPFAKATTTVVATSLYVGTSLVLNDASTSLLEGVTVDSSVSPFPVELSNSNLVGSKHNLIATGVRSVTFVGFKVYAAGLYVQASDEAKIASTVTEYLKKHELQTVDQLLNDKDLSQKLVDDISLKISYAVKITPVRNTDYGHLRDGLTKSILAHPMSKTMREEVGQGVEQLRNIFKGFKGSVAKNDNLWLVAKNDDVTVLHEAKKVTKMGTVTEPSIKRVLLVLYLSSARPLSEPLRASFMSYVSGKV